MTDPLDRAGQVVRIPPARGRLEDSLTRIGDLDLAKQIQFLAGVIVTLSERIAALEQAVKEKSG